MAVSHFIVGYYSWKKYKDIFSLSSVRWTAYPLTRLWNCCVWLETLRFCFCNTNPAALGMAGCAEWGQCLESRISLQTAPGWSWLCKSSQTVPSALGFIARSPVQLPVMVWMGSWGLVPVGLSGLYVRVLLRMRWLAAPLALRGSAVCWLCALGVLFMLLCGSSELGECSQDS